MGTHKDRQVHVHSICTVVAEVGKGIYISARQCNIDVEQQCMCIAHLYVCVIYTVNLLSMYTFLC